MSMHLEMYVPVNVSRDAHPGGICSVTMKNYQFNLRRFNSMNPRTELLKTIFHYYLFFISIVYP